MTRLDSNEDFNLGTEAHVVAGGGLGGAFPRLGAADLALLVVRQQHQLRAAIRIPVRHALIIKFDHVLYCVGQFFESIQ